MLLPDLRFFMHGMLDAPLAVLLQFQTVLERLLVLERMIVDAMAVGAFHADEVVLGHNT